MDFNAVSMEVGWISKHFGLIPVSILTPFWLIFAPFGILFSSLDFASVLDQLFLDF